ncbi:MAG: YceI family protein [Myxococcales bacterium]|nr:YceI family protein [Myxococcales bacterium]
MTRRRMMAALLALLGGAALAEESDQVLASYQAQVGDRQISGVSRSLQWRGVQLGDGAAQIQLRVPVDSFDSGHREFDSLVRAALQSDRHPFVEVEGVLRGKRFEGTLMLRGVARPLEMPVTVARVGRRLIAETSFAIDLRQFGIALPSVGRRVTIDFVARISADPQAVLAGGALNSN